MKRIAANLTGRLTRLGLNGSAVSRKAVALLLSAIDDRYRIQTRYGSLSLRIANPMERWRAETLFDKEPDTIAWLDATIRPDSTLYDVGANIGVYTIYAAHMYRGATRVVAFEPEALNFARLYQNIFDNGLRATVGALPVALGNGRGIKRLHLSSFEAGRARHLLGTESDGEAASEWTIAATLNAVIADLREPWSRPTHFKIDVDGPELEVLMGARAALAHPKLCHVVVELSLSSARDGIRLLGEAGFKLTTIGESHEGWANHFFERVRSL